MISLRQYILEARIMQEFEPKHIHRLEIKKTLQKYCGYFNELMEKCAKKQKIKIDDNTFKKQYAEPDGDKKIVIYDGLSKDKFSKSQRGQFEDALEKYSGKFKKLEENAYKAFAKAIYKSLVKSGYENELIALPEKVYKTFWYDKTLGMDEKTWYENIGRVMYKKYNVRWH